MLAEHLPVLTKSLHDQRRGLLLWTLAFVIVIAMYTSFYPTYHNNPALTDSLKGMPDSVTTALGLADLTSGAGFLRATVYGLLVPVLMIIFATMFGTRAIAGDEESGTLDLYLSYPLSRTRLVLSRAVALTVPVLAFGLLSWLEILFFSHLLDMDVSATQIAATSLGLALMSLLFGMLAIAVGSATGRRSLASGATAAAAVASYLIYALAPQSDMTDVLKYLSPFYYYLGSDPLRTGFNWLHIAILTVVPLVLLAIALVTFNRRDVRV